MSTLVWKSGIAPPVLNLSSLQRLVSVAGSIYLVMINVGYLITRWALERKECRGLHFTTDYPLHAYDKK